MAQTTLRQMAGELHVSLKQSFDDADITLAQVAHWCQFFINKFASAKIATSDSGLYLSIYTDVPVVTPTVDVSPNIIANRKYAVLPNSIHDFDLDKGVKYISYTDFDEACGPSFTGVRFIRTSTTKSKTLYFSPYTYPKPSNPYFYRVRNNIYFLGVEKINLHYVEMGLYTTFDPFTLTSMDEPLYLDEALMADVYKNVLDIGRFVMLVPSEIINEGSNSLNPNANPKQRVVSLNEQQQQ